MSDNGSVFSAAHIARYGAGDWGTTSVVLEKPAVSDDVGVFEYRPVVYYEAVVSCDAGRGRRVVLRGPCEDGAILVARLARVRPTPKEGEEDNGQHNEIRRPSDSKDNTLGGPRSNAASLLHPDAALQLHTRSSTSPINAEQALPPSPFLASCSALNCQICAKGHSREESTMSGNTPAERRWVSPHASPSRPRANSRRADINTACPGAATARRASAATAPPRASRTAEAAAAATADTSRRLAARAPAGERGGRTASAAARAPEARSSSRGPPPPTCVPRPARPMTRPRRPS